MSHTHKTPQFREKVHFSEGILNLQEFTKNYILRCYEPSEAMAPFVEHYFISRRRPHFDPHYVGHDVLSQPVASLFIQPEGAFFQGPTTGKRTLRSNEAPIYVGAQFKPGGFYPFWHASVSELSEKTIPAAQVIPEANSIFTKAFLEQSDEHILATIDSALRSVQPEALANIDLINRITSYIEQSSYDMTVVSIAKHFAISERTLQQLFHTYVGVGVKWAIMRARFLEITKRARDAREVNWTALATEFGYSDQPHFTNDFKKIVGISPRQYVKLLSE